MNKSGLILLVTDSGSDAYRLEEAFQKAGLSHPVRIARRAEEVYCYLQGIGIYNDRINYPLPVLMILDLSMQDNEGVEVLEWLDRNTSIEIPVIAIGAAESEAAIRRGFDLGIIGYFEKPTDFHDLAHALFEMESFGDFAALTPEDPPYLSQNSASPGLSVRSPL